MISLKEQVHAALAGACETLVYGYPRSFTGREAICWRESANFTHARADGREHLAELNYAVEIFAPGAERADALICDVDARLQGLGLRRESTLVQLERDLGTSHVSARYRALADAQGNIYQ